MNTSEIYNLTLQDRKTLVQRALKLSEEAGELAQAVLSATHAPGCDYKQLSMGDVREEAADVLIVALSILAQASGDQDEFERELASLMEEKSRKWRAVCQQTNDLLHDHV
ncbi:hypothetical protein E1297_18785 [Roseibium sp. RKSG952]|nr:hypothetical protein [Roseibium sp. RKSG952]